MQTGTVKRVTIFIDETDKWKNGSLSSALLDRMRKEGVAGGTVMRGSEGFGVHRQVHTTGILDLASNMPLMIIIIDEPAVIERVLPLISEMVTEGLILVEEVQAIRKTK